MRGKAAVLVTLCVLGCGESDDLRTSSELWCDGLCAAERSCGDTRAPASCRSACVSSRPGLANISRNGAAALEPCVSQLSCTAIYDDEALWEAELDACWDQAKLSVEPTPHVREFCAVYSETAFECGYWFSTDKCEGTYGMWADRVLDRVSPCAHEA